MCKVFEMQSEGLKEPLVEVADKRMIKPSTKAFAYFLLSFTLISFVFLYLDVPKTVQNFKMSRSLRSIYTFQSLTMKTKGDVYVVLSGDMNFHYLLATPFAVQHWLNLNVSSIVMLCGKQEEYEADKAANEVLLELERLGAVVIYMKNGTLNSNNFAQNMRNYAAATQFVHDYLDEKTVLVTSDVDFYPFHREHHIPDVSKGKEIFFYNPNCCGNQEWKGLHYHQYIMITIAMTVRRWKEVMEISPSDIATGKYIEEKTNATFDNELYKYLNNRNWMWYLDQRLFGLRYHHASRKYNYKEIVSTHTGHRRIDRAGWKSYPPKIFDDLDLKKHDDAHTSPAIYTDEWWRLNLPFYRRLFSKEQLKLLTDYRNRAVKHVNQQAAAKRHFHP